MKFRYTHFLILIFLPVLAGVTAPRSTEAAVASAYESWAAAYEDWAPLLRKANEASLAEAMKAKATELRKASSTPGSTYLGFNPAFDLKEYAGELRKLGRESEAKKMEVLAKKWGDENLKAYLRQREQYLKQ